MLRSRSRARGLRGLADDELIGHVRDGDASAFEVVFDRHSAAAFSLAYRMCGRRGTAEDVVQDAFLSLWRSGMHYERARGSVRAWVLGAVRNKAIDSFRHETVTTSLDVHDEAAVERMPARERTDGEAERRADALEIRGALEGLPSEQRRVIELAYFGGFTHSQIAELLELPTGTVKGRMRMGLTKLRLALGVPAGVAVMSGSEGAR
jgi:RNA polymerase sigma-70 factor, ECF subfamily